MRVVISGCSGGGKSTLLDELAAHGYGVRKEPGREVVRDELASGGDGLPWADVHRFIDLCIARALEMYDSVSDDDGPVFFDRSLIDSVAAARRVGHELGENVREAVARRRYARTVFFVPPWEELFRADRERRHSFEDATVEYESLLVDYPEFGYCVAGLPRVSVAERVRIVEETLRR